MGRALMAANDPLRLSYTDNQRVTIAERLAAEIRVDGPRLWVASGYFAPSAWAVLGEALGQLEEFRLLLGKDLQLANLERPHEEARIADLVRQAIRNETELPTLASRDEAENVAALIAFLERHQARGEPVVKLWERDFLQRRRTCFASQSGLAAPTSPPAASRTTTSWSAGGRTAMSWPRSRRGSRATGTTRRGRATTQMS